MIFRSKHGKELRNNCYLPFIMRKHFFSYLSFRFKAKRRHGVHSPLVYNFTEHFLQRKHYSLSSFFFHANRAQTTEIIIENLQSYFHIYQGKNIDSIPPLIPIPHLLMPDDIQESYHAEEYKLYIWKKTDINEDALLSKRKTLPVHTMIWDFYFLEIWIIHPMIQQRQIFYLK